MSLRYSLRHWQNAPDILATNTQSKFLQGKIVYIIAMEIDGRYRSDKTLLKSSLIKLWVHPDPNVNLKALSGKDPLLQGFMRFKLDDVCDTAFIGGKWQKRENPTAPEHSTDRQLIEDIVRSRYLYRKSIPGWQNVVYDIGPYKAFYNINYRDAAGEVWRKWQLLLEPLVAL